MKAYFCLDIGKLHKIKDDICPYCNIYMNCNTADLNTIVDVRNENKADLYDCNVSIVVLKCVGCGLTLVRRRK